MVGAEEAFRTALFAYSLPSQSPTPGWRHLLRGQLTDQDLAAVEGRVADDKVGEGPRDRLLFALAHAAGRPEARLRTGGTMPAREANALTIKVNEKRATTLVVEHERFVDSLKRAGSSRDLFERLAGAGSRQSTARFVLGLPRLRDDS